MDILAVDEAAIDAANLYATLAQQQYQGWSVISSRPVLGNTLSLTTNGQTTRLSQASPFAISAARLVYANWQANVLGSNEAPLYSAYRVRCAIHKAGASAPDRAVLDPVIAGTFGGTEFGKCAPGQFLFSDPIPISAGAGEMWWHESYVDPNIGAGPPAPTLTATTGGSLLSGTTYAVALTYVYPDGTESSPGASTTCLVSGGNLTITVTSPATVAGAIGYRAYLGTTGAILAEPSPFQMFPLGADGVINNTAASNALNRLTRVANTGYPTGRGTLAGVGESAIGRDYTTVPIVMAGSPSFSSYFSPIAVLGLATDGRIHPSVELRGDSIQAGTGDEGYGGALGGFGFRACANQTAGLAYDPARIPVVGMMSLAQGGEAATNYATENGGSRRRFIAELCTNVMDNYGTNDLGVGSALIVQPILSYFAKVAGRKGFFRNTLLPKTTSSDGWKTVANQAIPSTDAEADRRAVNNWITSTTGSVTVTAEALFRSPTAGTMTPASAPTGGDGTAVKFFTAHPFRTGTEVVQVAGVTKTVTTDYTYRGTAVLDGQTYASGITFVTAPANTAAVTATYTKVAGFRSRTGASGVFDTASAVEVDATGTAGVNGGWWKPAVIAGGLSSATTSSAASTLTDSTKAWTVDQWRGWSVIVTADATTPAAVGQRNGVRSNTSTALSLTGAWATTPSVGATYQLYQPYCVDGVHPSSIGHQTAGAVITPASFI